MRTSRVSNPTSTVCQATDTRASLYLTTADVARWLERSTRAVRWMALTGQLASERTKSGQRLFRREDVRRFADRRGEARYHGVKVLRPHAINVPGEPQQLSFFWPGRLRMARVTPLRLVERNVLPHAEVLRA